MVAEQLQAHILICKKEAEDRETLGMGASFESSKPSPSETPPPVRSHILILHQKPTNWGSSSIQD